MPSTLVPDTVAFSKRDINENSLPYSSILVVLLAHVYQKQWNGSFQLWNSSPLATFIFCFMPVPQPTLPPPNRVLFISYLNNQFDRFKKSLFQGSVIRTYWSWLHILQRVSSFAWFIHIWEMDHSLTDYSVVSHIHHSAWYSDPLSPGGAAETFWENQEANMCSCEDANSGFPKEVEDFSMN